MFRPANLVTIVGLLVAAFAAPACLAQWSTDPAQNLVVANGAAEQVQAKLVARADGGFYVSWLDASSGYSVRLQRLDALGVEQWAHNGIVVATRSFSSTQDYGLAIDTAGNALLAFRYNDGGGTAQILTQKISPAGAPLWGSPGIFLTADAGGANAPKITGTSDGAVGVAWSGSTGALGVQKLDANGAPLWGASGISLPPASGFFFLADLHGDNGGNVIASWSAQLSFADRELWAQKFAAADGAALWGAPALKIFDGTVGAMQLGYFPPFLVDGAGGAVFVWYTVGVNSGTVRVQHVDAAGAPAFAQNGVEASGDGSQSHVEPSGAFDSASGDIYALWRETDIATQSQIGVYAQRIDSSGTRQWGVGGKVLVALGAQDQTQMRALPATGGLFAAWVSNDAPSPMPIHVARLASDGSHVWPGNVVDIATGPRTASRLAGAISAAGFAAYTWTAEASGSSGEVRAQNINIDGSLGNPDLIFEDGFDAD